MSGGFAALGTERLILREWRSVDREAFARMNMDPVVMEHFPALLSREETEAMVDRIEAHFEQRGFGLWAAELRDSGEFIGYVGLAVPRFEAAFTPCVEIGWRLAREHWGKGLATEGALEAVRCAFEDLRLKEIVSFTVPANVRSRRVMEKLGMTHDPADDFEHPSVPEGHALRRHVLYRLKNPVSPT
ncbi:MAG TPA: GNAT family N-acetyltransferase [Terracidiphilus sp.]|jgi:RimJ/RimL family protein N-acetyltransferase